MGFYLEGYYIGFETRDSRMTMEAPIFVIRLIWQLGIWPIVAIWQTFRPFRSGRPESGTD